MSVLGCGHEQKLSVSVIGFRTNEGGRKHKGGRMKAQMQKIQLKGVSLHKEFRCCSKDETIGEKKV